MQKKNHFDRLRQQVPPQLLLKWETEQRTLRVQVRQTDQVPDPLQFIAGFDISASKTHENIAVATLVILQAGTMALAYEDSLLTKLTLPYVPGLLAFRELGPLLELYARFKARKLACEPDVILTDGNGILHVNGFGLACHLGILLDKPTIGCGKTMFYVDGLTKDKMNQLSKGLKAKEHGVLVGDSGRAWGAVLRASQDSVNPLIVSVGHKVSLERAVEIVKGVCQFRVPEPVRLADKASRRLVEKVDEQSALKAQAFAYGGSG